MRYNPLYGSVPYLSGEGRSVVYAGGGWRTVFENEQSNPNLSARQKFENVYKLFVEENGYKPDEIKKFLTGDEEASKVLGRRWYGFFGPYMMANGDLRNYYKDAGLKEEDLDEFAKKYGGGNGESGVEEITGDVGEQEVENPEEDASEQKTPAAGGSTGGATGGGPTVITDMGGAQQDAGGQQQTGGYDLDALQQVFDRISAHIAQRQAAQQQQQQQPAPEQPQYRIGVGDLFGMDRWQRRQLSRGRKVQLANGEWVIPTSRWSGRHLAHDIRTERKHGKRDARREQLAQYYNPARKARYDSRRPSRADREASHYVNIGQYVLPYENATA